MKRMLFILLVLLFLAVAYVTARADTGPVIVEYQWCAGGWAVYSESEYEISWTCFPWAITDYPELFPATVTPTEATYPGPVEQTYPGVEAVPDLFSAPEQEPEPVAVPTRMVVTNHRERRRP